MSISKDPVERRLKTIAVTGNAALATFFERPTGAELSPQELCLSCGTLSHSRALTCGVKQQLPDEIHVLKCPT